MSVQAYCLRSAASHPVCGVAQGPKADEVIVTVQNDGVVCYSSIRQEQTKSWALASQHSKFVVPAIYCHGSDHYFAVVQESQTSTSTSQTLLSWPASVTLGSLEHTATHSVLHGSVHSLHTVQAPHHVMPNSSSTPGVTIVFTDGTVSFSGKAGEAAPTRTAGARVINATIDSNKLAVISATESGLHWTLDVYSLQGSKLESTYNIPAPQPKATLVSASYNNQQLLVLWSNGTLQSFDIRPRSTALKLRTSQHLPSFSSSPSPVTETLGNSKDHTAKPSKALTAAAAASSKASKARKRRQPEADSAEADDSAQQSSSSGILPLGSHAVAAVREVSGLPTNGHAASAIEVIVTDSNYGCIQSVTGVRLPKAQTHAQLQLMQNSIFQQRTGKGEFVLLYGNAVWLFRVPVKPATLASAIGALNVRAPTTPTALAAAKALGEEACASCSTPPQVEHARPAWTQSLAESQQASTSGQPAWSPVPATFTWQLDASSQQAQLLEEQLIQQLTTGWTDKEACRAYLIDIMRTCRESKFSLSRYLVLRLVAYLTQHQWWGALDVLLRQQPLPSLAMCPGLLLTLCQQGQFAMLPALLTKAKDMPPQELTALLYLFLSPASDPLLSTYQQHASKLRKLAAAAVETAEKACLSHVSSEGELAVVDTALQDKVARAAYAAAAVDGLIAQEVCFHPIVGMTHDSTLLLSALRQLSGSQALALGQYLLKLMTKYSAMTRIQSAVGSLSDIMPPGLEESKSPLRIPKLQQVLEWIALLLDAHIHSLYRQPGSIQVLSKLQKLVQQHVGFVKQMATLRGIAEHITSHAVLPYANQQADSLYSVELLDFRIHG